MKAMLCKEYGPPESLVLEDHELPPPADNEVRVRVRVAGVNFPDILIIQGTYQFKPPFPFSPGSECAGDVIAVGAKVTQFKPGDRVIAMTGNGAFAEEVNAREVKCLPLPDGVDYEVGSAFVLTYGTSAYALMQMGNLQPDEWLLVHGAAGGVGLSAVEIGKAMGARIIGTGSTDEKLQKVLEHGADHVINYNDGPFKDQVKEICGGAGADVIYDPVGGDVFDQSLRCINWNGRLLVIGFASGRIPEAPANLALLKNCSIVGVFWGAFTERYPEENRANIEKLFEWYREGKLRPNISHRFTLSEVPDALYALINREVVGKAVVTIDG
ncbi:MAG: NADPH:quinone oxidoreductase family protein [Alphaproteobacteria bacterium]|jgi:NADPH2:quinone reductase|nr:NADPH:quinone oxidoreductase family protein [Alphaproteobacteria bacterium]MDP6566404.1 NADPH:quinone oxidoreductase family protein [Alphaproteobacteria bacterium]MDP6811638.1 NADPH:quinone oxidoreductase family protein [Alphaproteobacteria bacterium]